MLSCLLVRVGVMQGVNAVHAEIHIRVCGLVCRLVDDVSFCLSLIRGAYVFRFSADWRHLIFLCSYPTPHRLLGRMATVYLVPSHNEGSARGTTVILTSSLCFSEQVKMHLEGG